MDTSSLTKECGTNLWEEHLDGGADVPPAIQPKESAPKRQQDLAGRHYLLTKEKKKIVGQGFLKRVMGTITGRRKKRLKEIDRELSETKKEYFKYRKTMRVSAKQQRVLRIGKPVFGERLSSPQKKAVR